MEFYAAIKALVASVVESLADKRVSLAEAKTILQAFIAVASQTAASFDLSSEAKKDLVLRGLGLLIDTILPQISLPWWLLWLTSAGARWWIMRGSSELIDLIYQRVVKPTNTVLGA